MNPFQAMIESQSRSRVDPEEQRAIAKIIYRDDRGVIDLVTTEGNITNVLEVGHFTRGVLSVRTVVVAEDYVLDLNLPAPTETSPTIPALVETYKTVYLPAAEVKRVITDPRADAANTLALAERAVTAWLAAKAEVA